MEENNLTKEVKVTQDDKVQEILEQPVSDNQESETRSYTHTTNVFLRDKYIVDSHATVTRSVNHNVPVAKELTIDGIENSPEVEENSVVDVKDEAPEDKVQEEVVDKKDTIEDKVEEEVVKEETTTEQEDSHVENVEEPIDYEEMKKTLKTADYIYNQPEYSIDSDSIDPCKFKEKGDAEINYSNLLDEDSDLTIYTNYPSLPVGTPTDWAKYFNRAIKAGASTSYQVQPEHVPYLNKFFQLDQEQCLTLTEPISKNPYPKGTYSNNVKGDKERPIGLDYLKFSQAMSLSNKDSESTKVLKLSSILGFGSPVTVTLPHSGFTVILKPAGVDELEMLEQELYKSELRLGRETSGLLVRFSKANGIEIIANYIRRLIIQHSLMLPVGEDIMDYISILDLDMLLLGIMHGTNVNKMPISRHCDRGLEVTEDGSLACTHVETQELDPSKMLWINKDRLSPKMLKQLSYISSNQVSIDAYNEYQRELKETLIDLDLIKDVYNIAQLDFMLEIPSINTYISKGKDVIAYITKILEDGLKSEDALEIETIKNDLTEKLELMHYLPCVKSIGNEVLGFETDFNIIMDTLKNARRSTEIRENFNNYITEYYINSTIAMIAIPNYVCPECNKEQQSTSKAPGFGNEFIPINMLSFFMYLGIA